MAKRKPAQPKADEFEDVDAPAMRPKLWPLAEIHPYPKNPRTHPPAQIALLAQILKKRGPDQPIVVDEDGVILKGHGRREAAIVAGFRQYPVVQRLGLSEEDKVATRIEDNQVALLSGWDTDLIRGEIAQLKTGGYDVSILGFGEQQLVQFMTTPGPPAQFQTFDENIETAFCCPKCRYRWSGNPLAGAEGEAEPEPKKAKAKQEKRKKK